MDKLGNIVLMALLLLAACNNSTTSNQQEKLPVIDTAYKATTADSADYCEDPSQDLVAGPLLTVPETPAEVKKWLGKGAVIEIETNTDPDDSTELDSTITVRKGHTAVRFLSVDGEADFWDADIATNSIPLAPQTAIGINKKQFLALNKLHLRADCDTLLVASFDENYIVTLYFRADTLCLLHMQEPAD